MAAVKDKIDLTEKEKQIFDRLIQVTHHFKLQTRLRVAGGWVRDKLLGKESHDIDIALDNMLGREFCEKVNEYLKHQEEKTHEPHVIARNPNQSKHLETATMPLFGTSIDFVNLRCEKYSDNSRIPTMEFGIPEQDAYRRDFTINSLFYNLHTSTVEDFTGRGLADLEAGRIVTPLPPKDTFLDDPLRLLRAIRFAARFGFVLDQELKEAAASDEVKTAFGQKISRERIGTEINLMLSGNQPVQAITYIHDLQLFWVVFRLPNEASEGCDRICVSYMNAAWNLLQEVGCSTVIDDDQRRLFLYASLFLPIRKASYKEKKGKKTPLAVYIFMNSIKLGPTDANKVANLHRASEKFRLLIPFMTSNEEVENLQVDSRIGNLPAMSRLRIMIGLLLKEIREFWRIALLLSILLYQAADDGTFPETNVSENLYKRAECTIIELGLDNVWEMKPLVDGNDIMGILQLKKGGPQVKEWKDRVLEWQLAHPSGNAEECLDWLRRTNSQRAKLK